MDMYGLQHIISGRAQKSTDDIGTKQFSKMTLQVPEVLGEVQEIQIRKCTVKHLNVPLFESDPIGECAAMATDMVFYLQLKQDVIS